MLIGTDNPIGFGNFGQVIAISEVAQTGLGNYQALRAATVEPAKIMGVSNQLGTIQPGMIADMDVIHGNPLQDIETIANDVYVMQNGNLYTPQQLIGPYAGELAPRLLPPPSGQLGRAHAEPLSGRRLASCVNR